MGTQTPSRRAVLGGAATLPLVMVGTVAACAAPTPAPAQAISSDLLALIASANAKYEASERHHYDVYSPVHDRLQAAILCVPHVDMSHGEIIMTTKSRGSVAMANKTLEMAKKGKLGDKHLVADLRAFRAACLRRERAIERLRRQSGISKLVEESNALSDAAGRAQHEVANFAVHTPADLAHKLAFMVEHQMGDGVNWLPELLADARTLANVGG